MFEQTTRPMRARHNMEAPVVDPAMVDGNPNSASGERGDWPVFAVLVKGNRAASNRRFCEEALVPQADVCADDLLHHGDQGGVSSHYICESGV